MKLEKNILFIIHSDLDPLNIDLILHVGDPFSTLYQYVILYNQTNLITEQFEHILEKGFSISMKEQGVRMEMTSVFRKSVKMTVSYLGNVKFKKKSSIHSSIGNFNERDMYSLYTC